MKSVIYLLFFSFITMVLGCTSNTVEPKAKLECSSGTKRECSSRKLPLKGVCRKGEQLCGKDGHWKSCIGEIKPSQELCDGLDNDCDGQIDEGFEKKGSPCIAGKGVCKQPGGKLVCSESKLKLVCTGKTLPPQQELCDGLDNDCDGTIDENCCFPFKVLNRFTTTGQTSGLNFPNKLIVNGYRLAVTGTKEYSLGVFNFQGKVLRKIPVWDSSAKIAISSNKDFVIALTRGYGETQIHLYKKSRSGFEKTRTLNIPTDYKAKAKSWSVRVSPDATYILGIGYSKSIRRGKESYNDKYLVLWETKSKKILLQKYFPVKSSQKYNIFSAMVTKNEEYLVVFDNVSLMKWKLKGGISFEAEKSFSSEFKFMLWTEGAKGNRLLLHFWVSQKRRMEIQDYDLPKHKILRIFNTVYSETMVFLSPDNNYLLETSREIHYQSRDMEKRVMQFRLVSAKSLELVHSGSIPIGFDTGGSLFFQLDWSSDIRTIWLSMRATDNVGAVTHYIQLGCKHNLARIE